MSNELVTIGVRRHEVNSAGNFHKRRRRGLKKWLFIAPLLVILIGLLLPERLVIPVKNATPNDWNHRSFWFSPWGKSGVHKGIDIFADKGRAVISATPGWVLECGQGSRSGKSITVLGPKWRFHYYAHLDQIQVKPYAFVRAGDRLGTVGNSGNAQGKPPHLHYAVATAIPYPWRWRPGLRGWQKMFFLNPHRKLKTVEP